MRIPRIYAATLVMCLILLAWAISLAITEVAAVSVDWIEGLFRWFVAEF